MKVFCVALLLIGLASAGDVSVIANDDQTVFDVRILVDAQDDAADLKKFVKENPARSSDAEREFMARILAKALKSLTLSVNASKVTDEQIAARVKELKTMASSADGDAAELKAARVPTAVSFALKKPKPIFSPVEKANVILDEEAPPAAIPAVKKFDK